MAKGKRVLAETVKAVGSKLSELRLAKAHLPDLLAGAAGAGIVTAAMSPEQAEAAPIKKGAKTIIEAFHGSPHKFEPAVRVLDKETGKVYTNTQKGFDIVSKNAPDRFEVIEELPQGAFRMDKIGTGEGSQAYGHGLYFADSEDVARGYRKNLTQKYDPEFDKSIPRKVRYKGIEADLSAPSNTNTPEQRAITSVVLNNNSPLRAAEDLREWAAMDDIPDADEFRKAADWLDAEIAKGGNELYNLEIDQGALYRAHLDVDPDTLLDWDKPLSEQPRAVIEKLHYLAESPDTPLTGRTANMLGESLQDFEMGSTRGETIVSLLGGDSEASRVLQEAGIPGIRYADAMSRPKNVTEEKIWNTFDRNDGDVEAAVTELMRSYHDTPKAKKEYEKMLRREFDKGRTYNYVMFDDAPISIQERGAASPSLLAGVAAGTGARVAAGSQFDPLSQVGSDIQVGDPMAQEQTSLTFDEPTPTLADGILKDSVAAMDFVFDALEMPSRGLHGLSATIGVLAQGGSIDEALERGATVSRQSIDDTARELGEYVADKTGNPYAAAIMHALTQVTTLEPL